MSLLSQLEHTGRTLDNTELPPRAQGLRIRVYSCFLSVSPSPTRRHLPRFFTLGLEPED